MTEQKAGLKPKKNNKSSKDDKSRNRLGLEVRLVAAKLLSAVIDKKTSLDGLTDNTHGHPQYLKLEMRDRALCRAMLGAALRHRADIISAITQFLDRPLPHNALSLHHILHIGACQILYLDVPDHASIDLAVSAAKYDPRNKRFAGLVNAVLRQIARNKENILKNLPALQTMPLWYQTMIEKYYGPEKSIKIIKAQEVEPPLDLTVKSRPEYWAEVLKGIVLPNGSVRIAKLAQNLSELAGYEAGEWWVQDVAASLPAKLFGDIKGKNIADLCAAPGGKTAQLALQGANVTAIDVSVNRLKRLKANMARLKFNVNTWAGNVKDYQKEQLFDGVLLDAPCSSTGTIRRHPDILWTKDKSDIDILAKLQKELLEVAIRLTKKDGFIIFANCSLAFDEGEFMLKQVLKSRDDVKLVPILPDEIGYMGNLINQDGMLRTTPADLVGETEYLSGMDGFFAAKLQKIKN